MSEITATEIFAALGAAATVIGGAWAAFVYWQKHRRESEQSSRALWDRLRPFHSQTLEVLQAAVVARIARGDPYGEFEEIYKKWKKTLMNEQGMLGSKGHKRAVSLEIALGRNSSMITNFEYKLVDDESLAAFGPTVDELARLYEQVRRDPHYFSQ